MSVYRLLCLAFCGVLITFSIPAATILEGIDAGSTPGTVRLVGSGVDVIQGQVNPGFDTDLYRVFFNFTGTLTIRVLNTTTIGTSWDPNLLVFNGSLNPIFGNDDDGTGIDGYNSRADLSITPGYLYIGVGGNNTYGYDVSNVAILSNDSGFSPMVPGGVLAYLGGANSLTGTYDLTFSSNTASPSDVPEPATFALCGAALGLLMLRRSR